MLRFLIKRNLSTLSTVVILLWIFILPFLESWWYIYQIIQGNYAYQPDWKENLQCFGLTIVHILITCIIYGIMGMFCCATSFYFRNRKTVYFVSIFFWLIEILKPGSLLLIFQPFQINSTLTETASGLLLFFVPAILYICILTRRSIYE